MGNTMTEDMPQQPIALPEGFDRIIKEYLKQNLKISVDTKAYDNFKYGQGVHVDVEVYLDGEFICSDSSDCSTY